MARWDVSNRLMSYGSNVTLVSAYAWRHVGAISAVAEEGDDHADSDADIPPPPPPPPPKPVTPPPMPPVTYLPTPSWIPYPMPTRRDVFRVLPVGLHQSPPPPPPLPTPPHDEPAVAGLGQPQPPTPRGAPAFVDPAVQVVHRRIAGRAELMSIRSDSCGIFVVGKPVAIRRILEEDHFIGPKTFDLPERVHGPGYPLSSYVGGLESVRLTLLDSAAVAAPEFPVCKEKCMHKSDPMDMLHRNGAHMPLAVFSAASRPDHRNRWFAGELLVIVRGIVAAAAPEALVAAVAVSPVAVVVVMLCGEGEGHPHRVPILMPLPRTGVCTTVVCGLRKTPRGCIRDSGNRCPTDNHFVQTSWCSTLTKPLGNPPNA